MSVIYTLRVYVSVYISCAHTALPTVCVYTQGSIKEVLSASMAVLTASSHMYSFDHSAFTSLWSKKQNQSAPIGTPPFYAFKPNSASSYLPLPFPLHSNGAAAGSESAFKLVRSGLSSGHISVYEKASIIQRGVGAAKTTPVSSAALEDSGSSTTHAAFATPNFAECVKPTFIARGKAPPAPAERKKGTCPPPTESEMQWKARACYFKHLYEEMRQNMACKLGYYCKKSRANAELYSSCIHLLGVQTQDLERVQAENDRLAALIAVYHPKAEDYDKLAAHAKRLEEEKTVHEEERARMQSMIDSMSSSLNTFIKREIATGEAVSTPEQFCAGFFVSQPCDGPEAGDGPGASAASWF